MASHFLRCCFNVLAFLWDLIINSLVLLIESPKSIAELFCHIRGFAKNLTSKCLDLLNLSWPKTVFLDWQIIAKFILILFFKEVNQELTSSEDLWLHYTLQELLIINSLFDELLLGQLLLLVDYWKRRDDNLRILFDKVVSQSDKVNIKSLYFPTHRVRMDDHHQRLSAHNIANLRCNQLIHICNIYLRVGFGV